MVDMPIKEDLQLMKVLLNKRIFRNEDPETPGKTRFRDMKAVDGSGET